MNEEQQNEEFITDEETLHGILQFLILGGKISILPEVVFIYGERRADGRSPIEAISDVNDFLNDVLENIKNEQSH